MILTFHLQMTVCCLSLVKFYKNLIDPILGIIYIYIMRVIARKTLREFWENAQYRDAEQPLRAWFAYAERLKGWIPRQARNDKGAKECPPGRRLGAAMRSAVNGYEQFFLF